MNPNSTNDNAKQGKQTRPVLLLWIIPLFLVVLLTGMTVIGVRLLDQSESGMTSQMKGLTILVIIIAVISLLLGALRIYSSVRYIQLPTWRWMASGFKGKPALPWSLKSKDAEAEKQLNRKESEHPAR